MSKYGSTLDPPGTMHIDVPEPPPPLENNAELSIAIIGAGPAGLMTACLLAKAGCQVAVFEMRERPTEFYGSFPVVLNRRGLSVIERLGEKHVQQFLQAGRNVEHLHIVPKNRTVAEVDTLGLCIMRDQAVGLLLTIADELGVAVHWQHKLLDIDIASQRCTFERADGEALSVSVQKCVGADGNYSKVRRVCEEKTGLLVDSWDWGVQMRYMLAPDPPKHVLPSTVQGDTHYVLGDAGYVCQQPNEKVQQLRDLCQQVAAPFAEHLLTSDEIYSTFYDCKVFDGKIIRCSSLAPTDWIALIGDAAHAVAPFTGEGINSALESAMLLADILATPGASCAEFDEVRLDDAHAACALALRNKTRVTGSGSEKCANTFSTVVLGTLKKCGCIEGVMSDYMLGKLAAERVWRYKDLIALDDRQSCCLKPTGTCCFYMCCCCCGQCG